MGDVLLFLLSGTELEWKEDGRFCRICGAVVLSLLGCVFEGEAMLLDGPELRALVLPSLACEPCSLISESAVRLRRLPFLSWKEWPPPLLLPFFAFFEEAGFRGQLTATCLFRLPT